MWPKSYLRTSENGGAHNLDPQVLRNFLEIDLQRKRQEFVVGRLACLPASSLLSCD